MSHFNYSLQPKHIKQILKPVKQKHPCSSSDLNYSNTAINQANKNQHIFCHSQGSPRSICEFSAFGPLNLSRIRSSKKIWITKVNDFRTRDLTSKQDPFSKGLLEDVLYLEYLNFLASSPGLILSKSSFFSSSSTEPRRDGRFYFRNSFEDKELATAQLKHRPEETKSTALSRYSWSHSKHGRMSRETFWTSACHKPVCKPPGWAKPAC